MPNASKEDLYACALSYVDAVDITIASTIVEASVERAKQNCESLDLRIVAHMLILLSMPSELDRLVKEKTASPFVFNSPEPPLEETFTSYYEIVIDAIPPNI